jgi:hypothetical protein
MSVQKIIHTTYGRQYVKSFTITVPAYFVHRGCPCKSLTVYTAYAGRYGKVQSYEIYQKPLQKLVLLINAGTIISFLVYCSVTAVASKACIFLTLSVASVRKQTIPTERPPLVSEVTVNFGGERVSRGQHDGSQQPYPRVSRLQPLLLPRISSIVLTRLSGPHSRPITSQNIW